MTAGLINRLPSGITLLSLLLVTSVATAERQLWTSERYNEPLFSPDGRHLLVQAFVPPRNEEIFLLSADGTEVYNLTKHPAADASPRWSPDGRSILFFSDRDGQDALFRMRPDGSDLVRIPVKASSFGKLSWSPDSKRILFEGREGVSVAAADGTRPRILVPRGKGSIWSPDGKQVLYWLFPQWEMRLVSVDDDGDRLIGNGMPITWTPDGSAIFYMSPWAGQGKPQHLFRVNADGSEPRRVLENVQLSGSIADAHSLWSPDGLRLALAVEPSVGRKHNAGIVILDREGRLVRDFRKVEWFLYDSTVSWRDEHTLAFSRLYLSPRMESKLSKDAGGIYLLNTHTGEIRHVIRNKEIWINPLKPPW